MTRTLFLFAVPVTLVGLVGCGDRSAPAPMNVPSARASVVLAPAAPPPSPTPDPPPVPTVHQPFQRRTILGMTFVSIPAGSFVMGAPATEPGFQPRERQRLVVVPQPMWVGQTEVTQAQYARVIGNNPSLTKGPSLPVTAVSWDDVQVFLTMVNQQSPEFLLRLPTEEEWEFVCRAGSESPFAPPDGNASEMNSALTKHAQNDPEYLIRFVGRFAWFNQGHPNSVGALRANAWGIFDMHGNVWEWCADDSPDGDLRPIRGGCWATSDVFGCRAAMRAWEPRDARKDSIGFRLVAEIR